MYLYTYDNRQFFYYVKNVKKDNIKKNDFNSLLQPQNLYNK